MPQLTPEIISAAIDGYEAQKSRLDAKIAELRAMLDGQPAEATAAPEGAAPKERRNLSAAARARIAEAQRKRWAAARRQAPAPAATAKPKRKLSAAGRRAIIAAAKKRWAAVRAAKAQEAKARSKRVTAKKAVQK